MTSPMMKQWNSVKSRHGDGILFFRMGDFFEFFHDDAKQAARLLGLTLTSRSKGDGAIPMAGVPVRQLDSYVKKLVDLGKKVVICDQIEDPSRAKGLVERDVTRIITPGTQWDEESLDDKDNNFLAALAPSRSGWSLSWVDISTGEFRTRFVDDAALPRALQSIEVAEWLLPESLAECGAAMEEVKAQLEAPITYRPDYCFDHESAVRALNAHFGTKRLQGFGIEQEEFPLGAAGAIFDYLQETQRGATGQIRSLLPVHLERHVPLDRATRSALELVRNQRDGGRSGSLLDVMDRTVTAMGARCLKSWILNPLATAEEIQERQDAVTDLVESPSRLASLRDALGDVLDVERLAARVGSGRASPRDLKALARSLARWPALQAAVADSESTWVRELAHDFPDLDALVHELEDALDDSPPLLLTEGGVFRDGYCAELDELRSLRREGKTFIANFQAREIEASGIPSLKIGYNRVFGYYIEVTNAHKEKVPPTYIRKQTLKNAERYITPELKEYEDKILHADERARDLEHSMFLALRAKVEERIDDLQEAARRLALLDVIQSLAELAREGDYCRPEITSGSQLVIEEGRHPVLVATGTEEPFVPNDLQLDEGRRTMLITGPNMAGKSTYIRQVALITLMAQMGSWVPAARAVIGVVDQVFTRVGASDDLARGSSTFMVEMLEVANILNNATERSLVILDEVGRGTSTWDGLSLAWAITEHLTKLRAKTLFATHYHELVEIASVHSSVVNYNVAVRESGEEIRFLHRIVEGATDKSYGIHVARLAGLPSSVIEAARRILRRLEAGEGAVERPRESQLELFAPEPVEDPIRERVRAIDINALTPLEALQLLAELKQL